MYTQKRDFKDLTLDEWKILLEEQYIHDITPISCAIDFEDNHFAISTNNFEIKLKEEAYKEMEQLVNMYVNNRHEVIKEILPQIVHDYFKGCVDNYHEAYGKFKNGDLELYQTQETLRHARVKARVDEMLGRKECTLSPDRIKVLSEYIDNGTYTMQEVLEHGADEIYKRIIEQSPEIEETIKEIEEKNSKSYLEHRYSEPHTRYFYGEWKYFEEMFVGKKMK